MLSIQKTAGRKFRLQTCCVLQTRQVFVEKLTGAVKKNLPGL